MSARNAARAVRPTARPLSKRGYTMTERIGEGSFGIVVVAARSARHRRCQMAIKIIRKPSGENDGGDCAAFRWAIDNEKRFARKFDHPYINAYHEIIETTKRYVENAAAAYYVTKNYSSNKTTSGVGPRV